MRKQRKGLTVSDSVLTDLDMKPISTTTAILYNTRIYYRVGNDIMLNTSGWKTNHTKNCMNDLLPNGYRVFQKNFEWFVETPKKVLDFQDGIVLTLE